MRYTTYQVTIRPLQDSEIDHVTGGTSGVIYAVAETALRVVNEYNIAHAHDGFGAGIADDLNHAK